MKWERREVYFSGRVQGVGFRYTTQRIAQNFDVRGFVRNLPDGRVQVTVEGEAAELTRFLDTVQESMGGFIHDATTTPAEYEGEFTTFEIRF